MAKKQQLSNNALATLVVAALIVSVAGVFLASRGGLPFTGEQTSNPNGTVQFTLQQVASLRFAVATVNFGTGFVNTTNGNTNCFLTTEGENNINLCRNFTTVTQGFALENDGTINLTVHLLSNATAAQFIGGTSPFFAWKITNNGSETGSCNNLSTTVYTPVNTSTATAQGSVVCNTANTGLGALNFLDNNDTLEIDINVTIPYDALAGTKRATLTATGTAV